MSDDKVDIEQTAKDLFFEMLREKEVSLNSKKIDGQIRDLNVLSDCLHEIASIKGGIGFTAFHHALNLAESVDYAIDNLKRIKELSGVLDDFNNATNYNIS